MINLSTTINDFITLRDEAWKRLTNEDAPSEADLAWLDAANNAVREMCQLTHGPTTEVLEPAFAKRELLRVSVCAVFVSRCRLGYRTRKRSPEGHHNSGATVAEVVAPHAIRALGGS